MSDKIFDLKNIHVDEKNRARIIFWGEKNTNENIIISVSVDGYDAEVKIYSKEERIYSNLIGSSDQNINLVGEAILPEETLKKKNIKVTFRANGNKISSIKMDLNSKMLSFVYNLEKVIYKDDGTVDIAGWAIDEAPVDVRLFTADGTEIPVEKKYRKDLYSAWPELEEEDLNAGFSIKIPKDKVNDYPWLLRFKCSHGIIERKFTKRTSFKEDWKAAGGVKRAIARSYEIANEQGLRALFSRLIFEIKSGRVKTLAYQKWIEGIEPSEEELEKQRAEFRDSDSGSMELFSIVVAVYKPGQKDLEALISSVKAQTYEKWELILADAAGDSFAKLAAGDERIKYFSIGSNKGISSNTNEAIKRAAGDWIVFADHDDTIAPDALYQIHRRILENPDAGFIYSDEDKISADGRKRFDPVFKTDYNPDLLCSENYISHLSAVRRDVMDEAGLLNPSYDGAQDYDFTLRCVEKLKDDQIIHIPEVLYHWRTSSVSTAADQDNKLYAFEAGKRAVQAHLDRTGIPAEVSEMTVHGRYRVHYHWDDTPLVSIIIPNKDHIDDLRRCIDSIREKTDYPAYEIIIIENNSEKQETFRYYDSLSSDRRIRVIKYKGDFNYSAINNYGAAYAKGEYLLLLNNDTEVISPEWMTEMVGICQRKDVGIVGAKLYYPDGTIQHAGVIIGIGGVAGHAFKYFPHAHHGTADRLIVCQDYSAVTAACMLVKKEAFDQVGGLSEEFAVAFNDIDFCMKVRKKGYRIVFTPFAELTHYESKSRGNEDTAEKQERFRGEVERFLDKWGDIVKRGDPYYNKHYSLKREDFSFNEDLKHE
ncbi:MAG: glycosyltransferase [Candidatus Weimeria sp.]